MERPVFATGAPRINPSVGFMAIVRTVESPMCWATSHTIVVVSPSSVRWTSRAKLISGSSPGGKSTSTTGPMTLTTRPFACPLPFSSAISLTLLFTRGLSQCFSASDDLHDLGRDLRLAGLVGHPGQNLDELLRVVGGRAHGPPAGRVLGGGRFQQGAVHAGLDVPRQQRFEEGFRLRLEDVLGHGPLGGTFGFLEHHGHESSGHSSLTK